MHLSPTEVAKTTIALFSDALNTKGTHLSEMDELTEMEKLWMNDIKATIGNPNILRKTTLQQNYCLTMEKSDLEIWMQDQGGCYLFFDGGSKGNLRVAGVGGIIINLDEQK